MPTHDREGRSTSACPLRAQCGVPGDLVDLETDEGYRAQLQHRWVLCKGGRISNVKYDGVEFAADGKWYLLKIESDGTTLTRMKGFGSRGTWTLTGGQLTYFIDGGQNGGPVMFQERPIAMRFIFNSEYVPAD